MEPANVLVSSSLSKVAVTAQDVGKGGLSLRGVAVTAETATTAETAKTVKTVTAASWYCILKAKLEGGKVPPTTATMVKTVSLPPLELNPSMCRKRGYAKGGRSIFSVSISFW